MNEIDFYYLDASDSATQDYQKKYGFQYQPYFILLDGQGNEVKRWTGYVAEADFEAAFTDLVK